MNSRDYKLFCKNHYYHIYNRGNNKGKIFLDAQDYDNFLKRIKISLNQLTNNSTRIKPFPQKSFNILAFCLMDNHFHLIISQNTDLPIGKFISKVCASYVWYFNQKYNKVGNLFQDIFKAKLIENDTYLAYLSAYIHNNPDDPLNYPYSSISEYLISSPDICDISLISNLFDNDTQAYKKFLFEYSKKTNLISHLMLD